MATKKDLKAGVNNIKAGGFSALLRDTTAAPQVRSSKYNATGETARDSPQE